MSNPITRPDQLVANCLTKREYFAALILAGTPVTPKEAVKLADELIQALNNN